MPLCRLVYISENNIDERHGSVVRQLSALLRVSNENNRVVDITGALIFDELWFLQALEGERSVVWQKFEKIREDERHANVVLLELVDIERRLFANWWMGLAKRNGKTEHLFSPYLYNGSLQASKMTAKQVVGLMSALAAFGLQRELVTKAV